MAKDFKLKKEKEQVSDLDGKTYDHGRIMQLDVSVREIGGPIQLVAMAKRYRLETDENNVVHKLDAPAGDCTEAFVIDNLQDLQSEAAANLLEAVEEFLLDAMGIKEPEQ